MVVVLGDLMGILGFLFLLLCYVPLSLAQEIIDATILVKGGTIVAETDDNFICATLDWWPSEKCNYNQCPWGHASVLNLDLKNPLFANAIRAFNPLRIRIGGSLQDRVVYDVGNLGSPCLPFRKMVGGLFGFSKGCLHMDRWDELNRLFRETGAMVTFGLNALRGRHEVRRGVWEGAWNSTNTHDFIEYTISRGYPIDSWEFGNELSGSGVGARVDAKQYGEDVIELKALLRDLYKKLPSEPLLLAPGGFFDAQWFTQLLQTSGSSVNVITHHIYNLGPGVDPHLKTKILDPSYLSKVAQTFLNVKRTLQIFGPLASSWVGESGGAFNSGGRLISDTFLNSFWYLDQLGMASAYNTKVYCRQTLIGGNYGLLNTTTFMPNPDYYSALLWHRLMGKRVLTIDFSGSPYLRAYAHCSKNKSGVTLLLINLSNSTAFNVMTRNELLNTSLHEGGKTQSEGSFMNAVKETVSWVGKKARATGMLKREEYHLAPKDGYLQSQTMLLNGRPLELTRSGDIPPLSPVLVDASLPVTVSPLSIAFASFPYFDILACS